MKHFNTILALLVVFLALAPASAQRRSRMSPALALATVTWSESGLVTEETAEDGTVVLVGDEDMRGIHGVFLRGAARTGLEYMTYARNYARGVLGRRRAIHRRWLWGLNEAGTRPEEWPSVVPRTRADGFIEMAEHAPWSAFQARWMTTLARAREVAALDLTTWESWGPCSAIPDDWGGAMDRERARRLRLIELECAGTDNDFYLRPSSMPEVSPETTDDAI